MSGDRALEDRIADTLRPIILANMRFPGDLYADRQARQMARELIRSLGLAEYTVDGLLPERWWSTAIQTQDNDGLWHWSTNA